MHWTRLRQKLAGEMWPEALLLPRLIQKLDVQNSGPREERVCDMIRPRKPIEAPRSFGRRLVCLGVLVSLCLGMSIYQVRADSNTLTPSGDTYVASGRPADNFSPKTTTWVGYDQSGGYLVERALLAFAPGTLPPRGSTIASASLHLYLGATTTGDAPMQVSAHRTTSNWDPNTVTWPRQPSFGPADASTSVPAVVLQWYAWDVKTALQTWSDQRDTIDFGLVLTSTALSGQHERSFRSLEYSGTEFHPYLEITYESPPPLTVSLKQTNLPGLKLQYDIAVSNPSKLAASSVKVAAPIPLGTTVQSAGGGTQVGSELQWTPGTLAAAGGAWNGSYTVAVTASSAAEQAQTEQTAGNHRPSHHE